MKKKLISCDNLSNEDYEKYIQEWETIGDIIETAVRQAPKTDLGVVISALLDYASSLAVFSGYEEEQFVKQAKSMFQEEVNLQLMVQMGGDA